VSNELAYKLMNAESPQAFLSELNGSAGWKTLSSLKSEVDRLAGQDPPAADLLAGRMEELALLIGDALSKAFAGAARASAFSYSGRYKEADSLYESAITTLRAARLPVEAAIIQKQQVGVLNQLGRYSHALRVARIARRALAGREPVHLAQLETNVGNIYYRLDRYKKALEHFDRARETFSEVGDDRMRAFVDFGRSNVFAELDQPARALELLESAAEAWDRTGMKMRAAQARFHIAYIHFQRGHYNTALASYYQAREQLSALESDELVAWCNLEISEILLALNSFDDAAENSERARSSFASLGLPYDSARASVAHALALMGQGRLDQAQAELSEARSAFARDNNSTFAALTDSYLSELALRKGDLEEAAARATSAMQTFSRQKLATRSAHARMLAARAAYANGDSNRAARMARGALLAIENLFAPSVAFQCHHLMGRIERDRNRKGAALAYFRLAVDIVEKMRGGIAADEFKATFLGDKIQAYEDTIASCIDHGGEEMIEESFRLVEASKSRALADLLARYVRDEEQLSRAGEETRARFSRLIEDLNWYSSQAGLEDDKGNQRSSGVAERYRRAVLRCERQIAQLFRRMESEDSAYAEIQRMDAASVSDLRGSLEEGEVAIEYFHTGDYVSAFVATRDRIKVVRSIAPRREVERLMASFRFQIEKFNYGTGYVDAHFGQLKRAADEHLSDLYRLVFAPLEGSISGDRLIVVPHGALHYVPFHALRRDGEYLVDRFEISYAPSAAVLKLCRERRSDLDSQRARNDAVPRADRMVAFGLAEAGTPNIKDEIAGIGSIFPDSIRVTGRRATRDNLMRLAPQARLLHIASHGYFRRDNPMFSFLKLADSNLNFYSLLNLKINAEMVTLSACHTGVNMVFPGDELHGLMRGFLYAGAPSLVTSLWAVSDRSTSEFMSEMYSSLRGGATKREALRQAQLAIKDAYGHPYYWAPFVLMGEPR
jgi:CHAT domain-containing protein/tetratricopeptide (TPR) repeat protein